MGKRSNRKKWAHLKIEVYGDKRRKRANYLPIPLVCLLKTTKNSIYLRMRIFFFPPIKLNGHPTPDLAKRNRSWKMELARSHLLTARSRSEQQSLDQDLNFSHIQICLDPGRWLTPIFATSILWLCVNGPIASHYTRRNHFHLGITLQENLLSGWPARDALLHGGSNPSETLVLTWKQTS